MNVLCVRAAGLAYYRYAHRGYDKMVNVFIVFF